MSELEGLFQLLRGDVEALFMQAPTVDLDALGRQLGDAERLIDEQGSAVQARVCVGGRGRPGWQTWRAASLCGRAAFLKTRGWYRTHAGGRHTRPPA